MKILHHLLIALLLTHFSPRLCAAEDKREILTFGAFAYLGEKETRAQYAPLIDYLNQTLREERIVLKVLPQTEIERSIARRELDIVTTNPTHFLVIRKEYPLSGVIATLVTAESGQPLHQLAGVIITAAGRTDINTLKEVRGKRIATPSTKHMGGYRAQAYELYLAGIHLPGDVQSVTELKTHQEVVRAVLDGRAEVGLVREGVIERMQRQGEIQLKQIKVINPQKHSGYPYITSTRLYPEWPVFALPHVREKSVRHVAAALFALEQNHRSALTAGIYGYTIPADYLIVEELARALRLPPFDQNTSITWRDLWQQWRQGITVAIVAVLIIFALSFRLILLAHRERQVRERTQLLLTTLGEGVFGTDQAERCTFINNTALEMLGMSEHEVLGQQQHSLFHFQHAEGHPYAQNECPVHKTTEDGESRHTEEWFTRKNGVGFPVDQVVKPIKIKGKIVGTVVAFQDISARKQTEILQQVARDEAERARQAAEAANMAKSRFLANMSHEIRTPMNAILGMTQLAMEGELSSQQRDYLGKTLVASHSLLALLNDILDYSKIEAGHLRLEQLPFQLSEVIQHLTHLYESSAAHKQIRLSIEVAPDVPHSLMGDALRLGQILSNLVSNALKFTEQGEVCVKVIAMTSTLETVCLRFEVSDSGIGMSLEQSARLFVPFCQADDSITRRFGGTGLGLSICKRLVDLLGGEIGVESQAGVGSQFHFSLTLRRTPPNNAPATAQKDQEAQPDWHQHLAGAQVLVVEDSLINQTIVDSLLSKVGVKTHFAGNGAEALDILAQHHFDAVLMDLQMPVMDGFMATRALRLRPEGATLPVIALSASAMIEDQQACYAAGMNDHIAKPIVPETLFATLARWIKPAASRKTLITEVTPPPLPTQQAIDLIELAHYLTQLEEYLTDNMFSARHIANKIEALLAGTSYSSGFQPVIAATRGMRFKDALVALRKFVPPISPTQNST